MELSAGQLAHILEGEIEGNSDTMLKSLAKIEEGKPGAVCFLSNMEYEKHLYTSQASAVIVDRDFVPSKTLPDHITLIRVKNSRMAFAKLLEAYQQFRKKKPEVHPTAVIEENVSIGTDVYIGPNCYIGGGSIIGNGCIIKSGSRIGDAVIIGENCTLHYNVVINDDCRIGNHCIIQHGAVIGGDGFGFQPNSENDYQKISHIGNVVLEDHVEVGSNTTIDRATLGSTIIGKGVKLDNLIQIGHNVVIGENTVIASQSGVAGSVVIGKNCMIGGQVGFAGHQKIADGSKFAAKTGVLGSIHEPDGVYQGIPAVPLRTWQKAQIIFKRLPEIGKKLDEIERRLNDNP